MKIKALYFILLVLVVASCDDRYDYFEANNQNPVIQLYDQANEKTKVVNDSLKYHMKARNSYILEYDCQDDNDKLNVDHIYLAGGGQVHIDQTLEQIEVIPEEIGMNKIEVVSEDPLGGSDKVTINLEVFENLLPVARVDYEIGDNRMVRIDASASYDRDAKFGGRIIAYEYTIKGDYKVETELDNVYYQFNADGSYIVKVRAKDNNEQWSEVKQITIEL